MLNKKIIIAAMALPLLVACKSFVEVEPGSENVTLANSIDQESCTLNARVKVRMTGYAERRDDYTAVSYTHLRAHET